MSAPLTEPQYSIIVPVYNVENYLAECIDSLLEQDMIPVWIYLGLLVLYAAELSLQKARSQSSEAFRFSSKKSLYA